jgi:hypothetical protein
MPEDVTEFLKLNLPLKKKSANKSFSLALLDPKYGKLISETLNIQIQVGDFINDLFRCIKTHLHKYLKSIITPLHLNS